MTFDPFRFNTSIEPAPVEGPTAPPVRLVDDDFENDFGDHFGDHFDGDENDLDEEGGWPSTQRLRSPLWMRISAGALALAFLLNLLLTAALTAGRFSPLTNAGDWKRFNEKRFDGPLPTP